MLQPLIKKSKHFLLIPSVWNFLNLLSNKLNSIQTLYLKCFCSTEYFKMELNSRIFVCFFLSCFISFYLRIFLAVFLSFCQSTFLSFYLSFYLHLRIWQFCSTKLWSRFTLQQSHSHPIIWRKDKDKSLRKKERKKILLQIESKDRLINVLLGLEHLKHVSNHIQ